MECKLSDLTESAAARVRYLVHRGPMRRRLQDLGFVPGAEVRFMYSGFRGGIRAYAVGGSVIALRRRDADQIIVSMEKSPE